MFMQPEKNHFLQAQIGFLTSNVQRFMEIQSSGFCDFINRSSAHPIKLIKDFDQVLLQLGSNLFALRRENEQIYFNSWTIRIKLLTL